MLFNKAVFSHKDLTQGSDCMHWSSCNCSRWQSLPEEEPSKSPWGRWLIVHSRSTTYNPGDFQWTSHESENFPQLPMDYPRSLFDLGLVTESELYHFEPLAERTYQPVEIVHPDCTGRTQAFLKRQAISFCWSRMTCHS